MRTRLWIFTICLLSLSIIFAEYLKHLLLPKLSGLESMLMTFTFVLAIVSAITFMIHGFVRRLNSQLAKKQLEKSKLESALHSSEEKYRAIFENSSGPIVIVDEVSYQNVDFNSNATETLGFTRHEFEKLHMNDYELVPSDEIKARFDRILRNGIVDSYESRFRKKSGEFIDVFVKARPLSFENRNYFLLSWDDVTERRRIQTRAIEQFEFLSILMETIPAPVFYKDRQGRYSGCNRAFEDFLGIRKNDIIGRNVYEISAADIAEKYFKMDEELLRNPGKQVYEWKVKTKKLGVRDVVFSKATFNDIKGNTAGIVGVMMDITDLKKAESEIQKSRDFLAAQNKLLLEWTSPEVLYHPDFEFIMTTITEKVLRILKVERVGIWLFNTDFTKLFCADLFDVNKSMHSHDGELVISNYPSYFNSLRTERVIVCKNALNDTRYGEFVESYLKPAGITSFLDVPVLVSGEIIGVICIEHRGGPRDWTLEEQNFALSVSSIFSLALEISRHKQLEDSLKTARDNFVNIIEKLPYPLLIVDSRGRLKYVNIASEKFFGPKIKEMLGAEFPYPLEPGSKSQIDFRRADGSSVKSEIEVVKTRWDSAPAFLVTMRESI